MGYRVHYLLKGDMTYEDHQDAFSIFVQQNHLHLQDKGGAVIAAYQSGWWIKAVKIESDKNS